MARNTFFALEDDAVANDDELVPEAQAEVEAGAAEADTRAREVEDEVDATEEAVDDIATLTDIQEVAQDSVDSGEGLDEPTARVIETAVENIRNRLNLPVRKSLVPAMESFGSKNSRIAATNVVIEGISDWLKKIWEGIKSVCRRLLDKIRIFFAGVFKSNDSLEKLLEDLKRRANEIPSDAKRDEKKLKHEGIAKAFSIDKKADLANANVLIDRTGGLLAASMNTVKIIESSASEFTTIANGNTKQADILTFIRNLQKKAQASLSSQPQVANTGPVMPNKHTVNTKNKQVALFGPYPGSHVLSLNLEIHNPGTPDEDLSFSFGFEVKEKIADDEIEALERNEIVPLISRALKLLDEKRDFDKKQKESEKILQNSEKLADSVLQGVIKKASESDLHSEARALKNLARHVSNFNGIAAALSTGSSNVALIAIKGAADYASASIKNFKTKK